jgi:SnoaL-like domain
MNTVAASDDWVGIYSVTVRYSRGLDTRDYELFRTCFTNDAVIRYVTPDMKSDITFNGPAEAAEGLRKIHAPLQATLHRVSNHGITISGDTASGRTYVDLIEVKTENGAQRTLNHIGFYDDEFVRTADGWKIKTRTFQGVASLGSKELIELPS